MAEIKSGDHIPKIIAFYLPQFHAIPENDYWWGKGFTEWTNVKKAKPLFEGHRQPMVPLNCNYYTLLSTNTQKWQAELAEKYGIFGFCYYHYWFKGGKKLLEKPAELMLNNPEIKQPFCFSWANENWSRNWDGGNREVMVYQNYGNIRDWEEHFQYLVPFFKDDRYIKFEGKPIFIIYKPEEIIDLEPMCNYLRKRAVEEGFPGLYLGYQFPSYYYDMFYLDSVFDFHIGFEPVHSRYIIKQIKPLRISSLEDIRLRFGETPIRIYRKISNIKHKVTQKKAVKRNDQPKHPFHYSFDQAWKTILNEKWDSNYYPGGFAGWDNTPRNSSGIVYDGYSGEKFAEYFFKLVERAYEEHKSMLFFNAWNEWGEGAILEPDEYYKFEKLEAIMNGLVRLKREKNEN